MVLKTSYIFIWSVDAPSLILLCICIPKSPKKKDLCQTRNIQFYVEIFYIFVSCQYDKYQLSNYHLSINWQILQTSNFLLRNSSIIKIKMPIPLSGAVVIVWQLELQLPMQSVPITTGVVSSNVDQGEVDNIM